jgi:hemoglobin-like flavoprotein
MMPEVLLDRAAIAIVGSTFASLSGREGALADRAFLRLFAAHPGARRRLGRNLVRPKRHLVRLLTAIATRLDDFPTLERVLGEAGRRHARYGATPAHYAPAREAVLGALRDLLGSAWTPTVERAWSDALSAASGMMLRAACRSRAA